MLAQGREGPGDVVYECHQAEQTLLYQLVEAHYPALANHIAQQGKPLPDHVHREFEAYLKCGRLEHGFLRVRCDKGAWHRLPGDFLSLDPQGPVLAQGWCRRGSEYVYRDIRSTRFQRVRAPDTSELEELVQLISNREGRCLERQGLLEQDTESAWLDLDPAWDTDVLPQILGSSIAYCIAVGQQQGQKAFMTRTIRPLDRPDRALERVAMAKGFSLHAGVSCGGASERQE